jgi:hypothetical protein
MLPDSGITADSVAAVVRELAYGDQHAFDGRGERIRTSGLYVPNVALYQAKLHPVCG